MVLADAVKRSTGEPGTAQYRKSLRDAIQTSKEVVGSSGIYTFTPGQLYGVDKRARVLITVDNGHWKLVP